MAQTEADRNLLFGILALQMDFINRGDLIAAMNAWLLEKHRPLEDLLLERGALAAGDRALLEPLVRRHIERHGGDPARSLASLSSVDWLRGDLAPSVADDPDVQASLDRLSGARRDRADPDATTDDGPADGPPGQRFRILRPHARGGLGEVFVARDEELHREVALKQIQGRHADHPESRSRFLREAEITGGLEHPGIIPVYSLGHDGEGRPYYAMRFIRGDSLKEAIDAFHRRTADGRPPGEWQLGLQKLLRRFLDVCNAVAYAHSRGVLHRDLKPGNVMVGPFGETLVVDWGLAKVVGRAEPSGEATLRPPSPSGSSETLPGSTIGTPAFMSPEQAEGRIDELGPASDVYSLGATLYCLLTGRPPIEGAGAGVEEVLRRVRSGDFPPPRQVMPDVPRAPEAICLKAMSLRPEGRYATPRALAEDIERWLADEPVSAYTEPIAARARRWMRRHRTLATSAAAVLVVGLAGLAAFAAVLSGKNRELDAKNAELGGANRRLERSNEELAAATDRANRARAESDRRLDQTLGAIEEYYTGVGAEVLLGRKEFEPLRARLLERPRRYYEQLARELEAAGTRDPRARALLARGRFGLAQIQQTLGRHAEARAELEAAIRLHLDRPGGPPDTAERNELARCYIQLGVARASGGDFRGAAESAGRAVAIATELADQHPDVPEYRQNLQASYVSLGTSRRATGDIKGAVAAYEQAIAAATRLTADHPEARDYQRGLARCYSDLGSLRGYLQDLAAAERSQRLAIGIYSRLAETPPLDPGDRDALGACYSRLGLVRSTAGDAKGAGESFRQAIAVASRLVAEQPNVPDYRNRLTSYYTNLGYEQKTVGDLGGAADSFRQAVALGSGLVAEAPDDPEYAGGLLAARRELGVLRAELGDAKGAAESLRQAIALGTGLVAKHPDVPRYRNDLAQAHSNLGLLLQNTGDLPGALASHRRAESLFAELVASQPGVLRYRLGRAQTSGNLGIVHTRAGDLGAAADDFRRAIALLAELASTRPDVPFYRDSLAKAHQSLGAVQHLRRDPAGAVGSYGEAIAIQTRLLEASGDRPELRSALGMSLMNLGLAHEVLGRHREAEDALRLAIDHQRRAVDRAPGVAFFRQSLFKHHGELARFLRAQSREEEAVRVLLQLRDAAGNQGPALYDDACALALSLPVGRAAGGDPRLASEAVQLLRAAVAAGWDDALHTSRDPDLAALRDRDDFRRLVAELFDRGFPANPFADGR